jgi:multidrug efflux system membrane fusion protein
LIAVVGAVAAIVVAYQVITSYVAYTDDAYVRSDLIAIAPEVTGRVIAVHVVDNQTVHAGDKLITIDPVPFQLAVDQQQALISQTRAQIQADQTDISAAQDSYDGAQAAAVFARATQQRLANLTRSFDVSRQELDQANDALTRSEATLAGATALIAKAHATLAQHQAALAQAQAELATAAYQVSRTHIVAPTDGSINNLTVRVGDLATINVPLIGIVDAHAWRVWANYKQSYLREFQVGQTGWVWLGSQPWHWHRAHITGIARGISRDPEVDKLLPYVAPTTDWIRLQRRFPVTLVIDDLPENFPLYMGADARTVIFP